VARGVAAIALAVLALAGAGLVAGCSDSASSNSTSGSAAAPNAAANGYAGSGAKPTSAASGAATTQTGDLIIMAGLQLAVRNPEQAAATAEQTVQAAGGYVAAVAEGAGAQTLPSANTAADNAESSSTGVSPMTLPAVDGAPGSDQALLLLRVPPQHLAAVLSALAGAGDVSYRTQSATDVTGQVADVASRITSAQASIVELRGMIDKAASMNDLISLEQALASRESDLESLEAQQRALADQVQYATVTVGYYEPAAKSAASKPGPHHNAFVAGLTDGWHALTATFRVLVAVLGWVLPFAVIVAILWWPARRLRRAVRAADPDAARTWWRRRPDHRTQ